MNGFRGERALFPPQGEPKGALYLRADFHNTKMTSLTGLPLINFALPS